MARVREAMLEDIENRNYEKAFKKGSLGDNYVPNNPEQGNPGRLPLTAVVDTPVFAALPMIRTREPVMTVRIGECIVDIQTGFEESTLEKVLRVVSRI
jgi:hypothetical protein